MQSDTSTHDHRLRQWVAFFKGSLRRHINSLDGIGCKWKGFKDWSRLSNSRIKATRDMIESMKILKSWVNASVS